MSKKKIVVVGNGMVGHKFIDNILQSDSDEFDVITFSEEPRLAYDRVQPNMGADRQRKTGWAWP